MFLLWVVVGDTSLIFPHPCEKGDVGEALLPHPAHTSLAVLTSLLSFFGGENFTVYLVS